MFTDQSHKSSIARRVGVTAVCALFTLLSGCMVGPDFEKPKVDAPAEWVGGAATQPSVPAAVRVTTERDQLARWWTTFDDATLSSLIERAIASNYDVKLALSRLRQSRASRGIAQGGLLPSVNASGGYARSGAGNLPDSDNFRAGLDAAWEVDVFGGIRRGVESADADIAAAAEDARGVLVSLSAEVALNYIDLRSEQASLAIAKNSLETKRKSASLTQKLFDTGFVNGLDVANAKTDVAATEAQLPTLEASIQQSIFSLALLLGREPGALTAELQPAGAIPPTPPQLPAGMPSDLLRRRPDIRRAEAQVRSANAQIGQAMADLFPKLTLSGNIGFSSNRLSTLTNWGSSGWSLGPSVTWQIFDAGRIRSNIRVKKAQTEQALLTYYKTVLTAFNETDSALEALTREQMRTQPLSDAVTQSRKSLELSTQLYTQGQTDFLNVLLSQRAVFSAEDQMVQSRRNLAANVIAVYKALGGGWEAYEDLDAEAAMQPAPKRDHDEPAPSRAATTSPSAIRR